MEERTAEITVEQVVRRAELRVRPWVTYGAKTDMGRVRENNEDKHEHFLAEGESDVAGKGHIFVVCDGMGGHEAGQVASELGCKTFIDVYRNHPSEDVMSAARSGVAAANRFILDVARVVPKRKGMGTTLSAVIVVQDRVVLAQVGDSRIYRWRGGICERLTRDHTWVEESVAAGMAREQAEQSPYRNMLTRAVGVEPEVAVDLFEFEALEGDVFMICSDGVTNHVSDDRIGEILGAGSPSEAAWRLVGEALVGGGSDNATAVVVRIDRLEEV